MTFFSNLLMAAGVVLLSFAAWSVQQMASKDSKIVDKSNIYASCIAAFVLILVGQLVNLKIVPAIIAEGTKEPSYLERAAHHEFKISSGRQAYYHKRAQKAATRASESGKHR
jgi:hypothetical protein